MTSEEFYDALLASITKHPEKWIFEEDTAIWAKEGRIKVAFFENFISVKLIKDCLENTIEFDIGDDDYQHYQDVREFIANRVEINRIDEANTILQEFLEDFEGF